MTTQTVVKASPAEIPEIPLTEQQRALDKASPGVQAEGILVNIRKRISHLIEGLKAEAHNVHAPMILDVANLLALLLPTRSLAQVKSLLKDQAFNDLPAETGSLRFIKAGRTAYEAMSGERVTATSEHAAPKRSHQYILRWWDLARYQVASAIDEGIVTLAGVDAVLLNNKSALGSERARWAMLRKTGGTVLVDNQPYHSPAEAMMAGCGFLETYRCWKNALRPTVTDISALVDRNFAHETAMVQMLKVTVPVKMLVEVGGFKRQQRKNLPLFSDPMLVEGALKGLISFFKFAGLLGEYRPRIVNILEDPPNNKAIEGAALAYLKSTGEADEDNSELAE